ncbi:hypothetical protein GS421_09705 [Rhodococcus hoagii]|nr:hypothetical protein [Prescottella equi]
MAPFRSALAERLNTVQLTWVGVLTLVIATTAVDGPAPSRALLWRSR